MDTLYQHSSYYQRSGLHPTRDGHQLLVVVRGWVRLPISHSEEELRMVEQIQLRAQFGIG